jgi:hypothetical protein
MRLSSSDCYGSWKPMSSCFCYATEVGVSPMGQGLTRPVGRRRWRPLCCRRYPSSRPRSAPTPQKPRSSPSAPCAPPSLPRGGAAVGPGAGHPGSPHCVLSGPMAVGAARMTYLPRLAVRGSLLDLEWGHPPCLWGGVVGNHHHAYDPRLLGLRGGWRIHPDAPALAGVGSLPRARCSSDATA